MTFVLIVGAIFVLYTAILQYLPVITVNSAFETVLGTFAGYAGQVGGYFPLDTLFVIIGLIISMETVIILLRVFKIVVDMIPKG